MRNDIHNSTRELFRFLIAGISAVATDTAVYFLLITVLDKNVAKGISFVSGTLVAYVINKYWTFNKPQKSIHEVMKFALLYSSTLLANILVNHLINWLLPGFVVIAFLGATGTSTILNFLGQKFWVFRGGTP